MPLCAYRGMNVRERYEPLLPHGHLQNSSSVFFALIEQNRQIRKEQSLNVEHAAGLLGVSEKGDDGKNEIHRFL